MNINKKLIPCILLFILVSFLYNREVFEKFELFFYDFKLRQIKHSEKTPAPFLVIGITENFEKKTGENFSRKHHIQLLKILKKEKAKVIGFDIFFPSINNEKEDFEFAKQIKECGNVVLPVFSPVKIGEKATFSYRTTKIRGSHPVFNNSAIALGHINAIYDKDQVIRKMPVFLQCDKKIYPQLSLLMAKIYKNRKEFKLEKPLFYKSKGTIPIDDYGCFYINFLSPNELKSYFIPFSDVLTGKYEKGIFRDKAVLIGQTILGAKNADLLPTPFGMQFGVFIQASALYSALQDKFFYRISKTTVLMLLFFFGFLLIFFFSLVKIPSNTLILFSFCSAIGFFSFYSLGKRGLFIDTIPFFFYTLLYYLYTVFYSLSFAVKKLFQKEAALNILKQVEEEITKVISPFQIIGLEGEFSSIAIQPERLIKQTPQITLKTILVSLGIERGCFIISPGTDGSAYQVITQQGNLIDKIDVEKLIQKSVLLGGQEIIINSQKFFNNTDIKNLMFVPIIFTPFVKIFGIFANKKPTIFSKSSVFSKEDTNLIQTLALEAIIAIQNARLNFALKETQMESIFRLSIAIEYRDRETGTHIHRVSEYAGLIAKSIGLTEEEVELVKSAMPLHDIGKIAIPDNILLKPEKLTDEERKIIEKHPIIGAKMLEGSKSIILKAAEIIALYHHEKYDGSGYPFGLKGNSIPLYGRIACLADIFDALSSKRIYKEALTYQESLEVIKKEKGKTFDPALVEAFLKNESKIKEVYKKYREKEKFSPFLLFKEHGN